MPRMSKVVLVLLVLALGGAGGYFLLYGWQREPAPAADPRLAYAGPYRNIHPDVKYVGSEACGNCHLQIAEDYARHAMGRSLTTNTSRPKTATAKTGPRADPGGPEVFERDGDRFLVERRDGRTWHVQQKLAGGQVYLQAEEEAPYTIGSGTRGHSYLSLKDGYVFQTPISWFAQKQTWDVSPGFFAEAFSRRSVPHECLFCHANSAEPWHGTLNRIHNKDLHNQAIGCERCHGPGERHVQDPGRFDAETGIDYTIVNPAKLPAELREAVCQQCHLEGESRVLPWGRELADFRPGLPLESCWSIFVHTHDGGKDDRAVNHVEQMYLSRCFTRSGGKEKLGCISCHDPHRPIAAGEKIAFYRERCLRCHADGPPQDKHTSKQAACALPPVQRAKQDNDCVVCHMPRYSTSDIAHTASTDHRIVRLVAPEKKGWPVAKVPRSTLVHFHRGRLADDADDRAAVRDMALALVDVAVQKPMGQTQLKHALAMFERARPARADWPAHEKKALALRMLGEKAKALEVLQSTFASEPKLERPLFMAGWLAQDLGKEELAAEYLRRAIDINPWHPEYRLRMAHNLLKRKEWSEALTHVRAWMRAQPFSGKARVALMQALVHSAPKEEIIREFQVLERLSPTEAELVKPWLDQELRGHK